MNRERTIRHDADQRLRWRCVVHSRALAFVVLAALLTGCGDGFGGDEGGVGVIFGDGLEVMPGPLSLTVSWSHDGTADGFVIARVATAHPASCLIDGSVTERSQTEPAIGDVVAEIDATKRSWTDLDVDPSLAYQYYLYRVEDGTRLLIATSSARPESPLPADWVSLDESEPNDASAQAQPVAYRTQVIGALSPDGEVDRFVFEARAGDVVTIHARTSSIDSSLFPTLTLYRDQQPLAAVSGNSSTLDGFVDESYLVYQAQVDGSYELEVDALVSERGAGPYLLTIDVGAVAWSLRAIGGTFHGNEYGEPRRNGQVIIDVHDGCGRAPAGDFLTRIDGPELWNGGMTLEQSVSFTGYARTARFPLGDDVALHEATTFELSVLVHGQELQTTFTVDPAMAIAAPVVTLESVDTSRVQARWDAVPGAVTYHASLYAHTGWGQRDLAARQSWLEGTSVTFEELDLDPASFYALLVSPGVTTEGLQGFRERGSYDGSQTQLLFEMP